MQLIIAITIFILTLFFVIWQPKGFGIGWSALIGALVAIAVGVVHLQDVWTVWQIIWNATFTFIALIIISLILDECGFFHWAALHMTRFAQGKGRRLFVYTILLGAVVSAFFANDGAALILTPIVVSILHCLGMKPKNMLAFVMAAGFIADFASIPLVVSNLVNIVSADYFSLNVLCYALIMVPINIVVVICSIFLLRWYFRDSLPEQYVMNAVAHPRSVIRDRATFLTGWGVLLFLFMGIFILEPYGVPVSVIAIPCAIVLFVVAKWGKAINTTLVVKQAPWQIVLFSLGMYLVVYGLQNVGLTQNLAGLLDYFTQYGLWVSTLATGFITAILSSIMNNLPSVLIGALAIHSSHTQGIIQEAMIYANIIGCDLGPKITPIGSLATLLWLHVLAKRGLTISWGYYFKVGLIITLPMLFISLSALAFWLTLIS